MKPRQSVNWHGKKLTLSDQKTQTNKATQVFSSCLLVLTATGEDKCTGSAFQPVQAQFKT